MIWSKGKKFLFFICVTYIAKKGTLEGKKLKVMFSKFFEVKISGKKPKMLVVNYIEKKLILILQKQIKKFNNKTFVNITI